MSYDKNAVTETFKQGKALLDSGRFAEAIPIFSNLITLTTSFKDSSDDADVTWHTSLNNRGIARCSIGYSQGNKQLFEDGMLDFKTAIESVPVEERVRLVAVLNLQHAEELRQAFDGEKRIKFKAI